MFEFIKNFFSSNNVTIINGHVAGDDTKTELRDFDETKSENADNIEKISIDSAFFNVNVSATDTTEITAHFYGQAEVNGELIFEFLKVGSELRIFIKFKGNCCNGVLNLDISVPDKTFKAISAKSMSANVVLGENVSSERLNVETQSGNFETRATFEKAFASTMSGNIDLYIKAKTDIKAELSTMSGNVSAELSNLKNINLSTKTMSGNVNNYYKTENGYAADLNISTMSGNIRVR